jgi:calcineurin-like phosphoesterase family protein
MTVWFTSDLHIGHAYVAELRGFEDVAQHDAVLAANWDRLVNPSQDREDHVWVLGDISAGGSKSQIAALAWLMQRPGRKHLITGNHDGCWPRSRDSHKWQQKYLGVFDSVQAFARRKITGQYVLLSHFPYQGGGDHTEVERYTQWRLPDMGEWLLHGHTHTSVRVNGKSIHVGVDAWGLAPVHLQDIERVINDLDREV